MGFDNCCNLGTVPWVGMGCGAGQEGGGARTCCQADSSLSTTCGGTGSQRDYLLFPFCKDSRGNRLWVGGVATLEEGHVHKRTTFGSCAAPQSRQTPLLLHESSLAGLGYIRTQKGRSPGRVGRTPPSCSPFFLPWLLCHTCYTGDKYRRLSPYLQLASGKGLGLLGV